MNTLVLNSIIACLSVTTAFGQTQSDVEFLRARADTLIFYLPAKIATLKLYEIR